MSSLCDPPVLFNRTISQPVLSDLGILVAAGVHFDVSGSVLYSGGGGGGDSVRARPTWVVSDDTSDGDRLPVTDRWIRVLYAGRWIRVLWLAAIRDAGAGPMAPPISVRVRTVVLSYGGWVLCIWIVYGEDQLKSCR